MNAIRWIAATVLLLSLVGCESGGATNEAPPKTKITYKCLSSSCDATATCDEADLVPQHCGKPMIR